MKINEKIFRKFSTNLHHICKIWGFELEERFRDEGYICPLSFKIHSKESLSEKFADQLTIEHAPPESLNGKCICLTNRISNSIAGHSLDLALQNHIRIREFREGVSGLRTVVYIEDVKMDGYFDFTDKENPKLQFVNKKWHKGSERVEKKIRADKCFDVKFNIPKDNRMTQVSLLRTAYLLAFGQLGYYLIFGATKVVNQNYETIRRQIQEPSERIIEDILVLNQYIDDIDLGINIIYEPKEYRSLFIVFEVKTLNKNWRYGVFLPGPDDYGFVAINNIKRQLVDNKQLCFKYENLPRLNLTDYSGSEYYYKAWRKLNDFFVQ